MSTYERDAYDALVNAGVDEDRARQILKEETGTDPVPLESVTVTFTLTVEVELDSDEVEGLTADDEDEFLSRAELLLDIDTYGVSLMSVDSSEVSDIV